MRLLLISDPVDALVLERDSSLALIRAAEERGHQVDRCDPVAIQLSRTGVVAELLGREVPIADFDVVLVRPDPPFDADFVALTHLLELVRDRTLIVNDPRGLRDANEKLYALRFPDLVPATVITASTDRILRFVEERGTAVLKPLWGHGGRGVMLAAAGGTGLAAAAECLTRGGRSPIVAQEHVMDPAGGDKRILMLDGAPLGAFRRIPAPGEFRANLRLGARVLPVELGPDDQRIVELVGDALRADGLHLAGLDVIGDRLIEVNVISPTGLMEVASLSDGDPAATVIEWLEEANVHACA